MGIVAGKIISVSGVVQAKDSLTGEIRILIAPAEVFKTDIILTSHGSGVVIQLSNGEVLTLGPKNEYSLGGDEYTADVILDDSVTEENYPVNIEALQQAVLDGNFDFLEATAAGVSVISSSASVAFILARAGLIGNIDSGFDTATDKTELKNQNELADTPRTPDSSINRVVSTPDSSAVNPFGVSRGNPEGEIDSGYDTGTDSNASRIPEDDSGRDPVVITANLSLTGQSVVLEGGLAVYTLTLDNPPTQNFIVNLQVLNRSTSSADLETQNITVEFAPNQQTANFSIPIYDDYIADNAESFSVSVTSTSGGGYTLQPTSPPSVQTFIRDDSEPQTPYDVNDVVETDSADTIQFTLYALDNNGQRVSVNQVVEGEAASYVVVATDKSGNELGLPGTIGINCIDQTAIGAPADTLNNGSQDYINALQTVAIGQVFTVSSIDDWLADSGEIFSLQLIDQSYSDANQYENIVIDSTGVQTTIIDDSEPGLTPLPELDLDTVYLKLSGNAVVDESDGAVITHFFSLVDKSGSPVNLAVGESIQLALSYSDISGVNSISAADFQQPLLTSVTLTGDGSNQYSFVNTVAADALNEGDEGYTVTLDSITTDSGYFENLVIDTSAKTATAIIEDNIILTEDSATVVEGGQTIGLNLLSNDVELGQNARIVSVTFIDENGDTPTEDLIGGTVTVDTQYGVLTLNEDGTGSYTSDQTENNPNGVLDNMSITLVDDNGKSASSPLAITVTDTSPISSATNGQVAEDDLPTGSYTTKESLAVTNSLGITKTQDDITDVQWSAANITDLQALTLKSAGVSLSYSISGDGYTINATAGSDAIFNVVLNNPTDSSGTTQNYTFTLQGPLDHADAAGNNTITLPFKFDVLDIDSTLAEQKLSVDVVDDVPQGVNEDDISVVEGNVDLTGQANLLANEIADNKAGADGHLTITEFTYTKEDGSTATVNAGTSVDSQYGTLQVNADGSWSYTSDASESQSGATVPSETITYTFKDQDGDVATASQVVKVTDGADPSIGNPVDQTVNEANLAAGSSPDNSALTQTGSLGVTKGSDAINTTFDLDQPGLVSSSSSVYSSGGVDVVYSVSADGLTLTAYTTDINSPVFTAQINDSTNNAASYSVTLLKPLDHLASVVDSNNDIVIPLYFTVTDSDGDAVPSSSFKLTIIDDSPSTTQSLSVYEEGLSGAHDTSATINTNADATQSNTTITTQGTYGFAEINADGTLTYTPSFDGSNAIASNYSGQDTIIYETILDDGITKSTTTIGVTINSLTDAPVLAVQPDVTTNEDSLVDLGLTLPAISDATDQNGAGTGDHAERLGYITLNNLDSGVEIYQADGKTLLFTGANDSMKISIVDGSGNLDTSIHHTDLDPNAAGVIKLTQAEFESLKLLPAENKHNDIDMTLKVTSYEVDDSGNLLTSIPGAESTSDVHVEVLAVTDTASLSLAQNSYSVNEDTPLTLTNDLVEGFKSTFDIDGSEKLWYEVSGLVEGTKVTINGKTYTADASGKIDSSANKITIDATDKNPAFSIKPPADYSGGDMNSVTVTLNTQDSDGDSTTTPAIESQSVTFALTVNPVAGDVTIATPQAGVEDTPIYLFKQTDGSSIFTVTDTNGAATESITNVGVLKTSIPTGATLSGFASDDTNYYYFDVNNLASYTITPPAHSSADMTLSYFVETTDGVGVNKNVNTQTVDKTIVVSAVSETDVTDSDGSSANDVLWNASHDYGALGQEDQAWLDLNSGFSLFATNEDTSETDLALISINTNSAGGDVTSLYGSKLQYSDGSTTHTLTFSANQQVLEIPAEYLDTLQFSPLANFSGNVVLDMQVQTQDFDEDTGTAVTPWLSDARQLTFDITPVADDVTLAVKQSDGNEDSGRDATGVITNNGTDGIPLYIKPTSDDTDGSQTYDLTLGAIPSGASISYDGSLIYLDSHSSGSVTIISFDYAKPLYIVAPHNSNEDITLTASAIAKDGNATSAESPTLDVLVKIKGVADSVVNNNLASETATDDNATTHDFNKIMSEADFEDNGILLNSVFGTPANIASYDDDSPDVNSESVSVVISGLATNFTLVNGTFIGGTGVDRKWSMTLEEFKATSGNVISIEGAKNFSGQVDFNINFITTENDGNSLTPDTPQAASVLVTPIAEAAMSLATQSTEDVLTKMNLDVVHVNEDNDETLSLVWIKQADISNQNFTVYVGNSTNTPLTSNLSGVTEADFKGVTFLKLESSVFNDLYVQYDPQVGVDSDDIAIKYQVEDTVTVDGNPYTNALGPVAANYSLVNAAVTDSVVQTITSFDGYDSSKTTVSGSDITLTGNDTLNVNLTMTSIDTDSSENITKLVIEGVPNGISVQGADYIGDTSITGGTEFSGTWTINFDLSDTAFDMDTDGVSYPLVFLIDGEPAEGSYAVDITAYNQDGIVSRTFDTDSFNFTVPSASSFDSQNTGSPMTIDAFEENSPPVVITEDTSFTLDTAINAQVSGSSTFSITLQNLNHCSVAGAEPYTVNGKTVYVITGSGSDIEAALATVTVTPDENFNSNDGEPLALEAVLTTYASGGQQQTQTFDLSQNVTPVTDELTLDETLTYLTADSVVSSTPQEDGSYNISIAIDSVDQNYTLVQGSNDNTRLTDITITHSGVDGELSWNGGSINLNSGNHSATVPYSELNDLTFTPKADASGAATFDYTIYDQENGANNIQTTAGSFNFDIQPVVDGLDLTNLTVSGLEDNLIEIKANGTSLSDSGLLQDTDGSESIQSLFVNNVPDGFLVFYGASGSTTLAQNTGNNGSPDENLWNIPISGGSVPQVWIAAPENYAGTLAALTLQTSVKDGNVSTLLSSNFSASWSAVADDISISPTKTFGDEATTIDLNLNASMQDIDGSETVKIILTGNGSTLPDGIVFSADGSSIVSSYDNSSQTYTLSGVTYDQINNVVMTLPQGMKGDFSVDVTAQTVELSNADIGTLVSGNFNMAITSQASGVTAFTPNVGNQVNTTISGKTVVNPDYEIALSISDIDLVDKDGSESLTIRLAGLTDALTVDVSALTGVTTEKQGDGSWLVELGNPTDGNYDSNLTALANGSLKLISTDSSGLVDSIDISAYSTLIETGSKSDETTAQNVPLNLEVDNSGSIEGTSNDDFIYGGDGDDVLVGGLGQDTLTGGAGADKFRIAVDEDSTDVVTDFTANEDKIDISEVLNIPVIDANNFDDYIKTDVDNNDLLVQIFKNGDAQSGGTATQLLLLDDQSALTLDENDFHQD